ncbi:MAG: class I SAM-dependent methyltransferase [Myxococcota bacterium]|nr:class I SAM-dependent methyltransferase [Myxococcota bacterium]
MSKKTRYDAVPYVGGTFQETHPDHLAALARLFGLNAPDPRKARILEIGCAHGANLIPMAWTLPDATLLGIDLSEVQIQDGNARVQDLGLLNLELRHQSVSDFDEGPWDYILCHGVYSWVPPQVQQDILRVIREQLSPNGVAYVSYNVYPGWLGRMHVREMMLFHAGLFESPEDQIGQARAILGLLVRALGEESGGGHYGDATRILQESLGSQYDSYIFHEYLSPYNEPIYFKEFARRLTEADLQYMGDGEFSSMLVSNFPEHVAEEISVVATELIRTEQYMDFLRNRGFRKSLICHSAPELDRNLTWEDLQGLRIRALYKPEDDAEPWQLHDDSLASWIRNDVPLKAGVPLVKAALHALELARPGCMSVPELALAARELLGEDPQPDDVQEVGTNILACFAKDLVEVRVTPVPWVTQISEKPIVWARARQQATEGSLVTSLMHTTVRLEDFDKILVPLLDGSRDIPALAEAAAEVLNNKDLKVQWTGPDLSGSPMLIEALQPMIQAQLERICRLGLLIG